MRNKVQLGVLSLFLLLVTLSFAAAARPELASYGLASSDLVPQGFTGDFSAWHIYAKNTTNILNTAVVPALSATPKIEKAILDTSDAFVRVLVDSPNDLLTFGRDARRLANGMTAVTINKKDLPRLEREAGVGRIWLDRSRHALMNMSGLQIESSQFLNLGLNGTGVRVCILDTGINKSNSFLATRVVAEADFTSSSRGPADFFGHGTHVAGIVASTHPTFKGIAPGSLLLNAKVLGDDGSGFDSGIIAGIDWCVAQNASILSMSFGGFNFPNDASDPLSSYVDRVSSLGKIAVVAAGNSGPSDRTIDCPGCAHNAITVGASYKQDLPSKDFGSCTDRNIKTDDVVCFSSRGPTNDGRIKPDLLAPGALIASLNNSASATGRQIIELSGTSMATPIVSGVAALMLQARSDITSEELKAVLMNTVFDYGLFEKDNKIGAGRVNASNALRYINFTETGNISNSLVAHSISVLANESVRATLYWPENSSRSNDIDLLLLGPDGRIYDSSVSIFNTDEAISFKAPVSGTWRLLVNPYNVLGTQKYALASDYKLSEARYFALDSLNNVLFHQLNVSTTDSLNVSLEWYGANQDLDVLLYNTTGSLISTAALRNGTKENVSVSLPVPGIWTLRIEPINLGGQSSAAYSISASFPISHQIILSQNPLTLTSPSNESNISGMYLLNLTGGNKTVYAEWNFYNTTSESSVFTTIPDVIGTPSGNTSWRALLNSSRLNDGLYFTYALVRDQYGRFNDSFDYLFYDFRVRVDNSGPTILPPVCSPATPSRTAPVTCNATISDNNGVGVRLVNASIRLPSGTVVFPSLSRNGNISGFTTTLTLVGNHSINFSAFDNLNQVSSAALLITPSNSLVNFVSSIPSQTLFEDKPSVLNISSYWVDADDLISYRVADIGPNLSVTLNNLTQTATLTPGANFTGSTWMILNATDGLVSASSNNVTIIVQAVNDDGPIIASFPTILVFEDSVNSTINLSDFVADPDTPDDNIIWTKLGDANINFTMSGQTARFSGITNYCGTSAIVLRASDGNSSADASATVNVLCVQDAPTISIISPQSGAVIGGTTTATLNWTAFDVDGDTLLYSVYLGTQNDTTLNQTTSATSLVVPNLVNNGQYYLRIFVMDGKTNGSDSRTNTSSSTQQFSVTVNFPPNLTIITPISTSPSIAEGKEILFNVSATDKENGALSYNWTLDNLLVSTAENFLYKPNFTDAGSHVVNVTVRDNAQLTASQTWLVFVLGENSRPTIIQIPSQTLLEDGPSIVLDLTLFEKDGEDGDTQLTWQVSDVDTNLISVSLNSATDDAIITPNADASGSDKINFTLRDSGGLTAQQEVLVTITAVNDAPLITTFSPAILDPKIGENTSKLFSVAARDADGTTPSIRWLVNGAEAGTGSTFTHVGSSLGQATLVAEASDGSSSVKQTWTIAVQRNPSISTFDGATTLNITSLNDSQLQNVENLTLQRSSQARIEFLQPIDLRDVVDLDHLVITGNNIVGIDSQSAQQLNKIARITIFNVNVNNPVLLFTSDFTTNTSAISNVCTFCTVISNANEQLVFETSHFSTFTALSSTPAELEVPSQVLLGGSGAVRNTTIEGNFVVKNKGTFDRLADIRVSGNAPSKYNLLFSINGGAYASSVVIGQLSALQEVIVSVRASVPEGEEGGEHDFADITVASASSARTISNVLMSPQNSLIIRGVDIDDDRLRSGGTVDIIAGSTLTFDIDVENLLAFDMNDIDVDITILDIDDGENLDESAKEFDLGGKEHKKKTLELHIPEELDEDDYDVQIEISGTDENGGRHTATLDGKLRVDKEKHRLVIDGSLSSTELSCDLSSSVVITVKNLGSEDEEDLIISADSASLAVHEQETGISLDSDDDYQTTFSLNLADARAGSYALDIRVYRGSNLEDSKTLPLQVKSCTDVREIGTRSLQLGNEQLLRTLLSQQRSVAAVDSTQDTSLQTILLVLGALNVIIVVVACAFVIHHRKRRLALTNKTLKK